MSVDPLTWGPLTAADLPELAALAARVIEADGGLPIVAEQRFLARRFTGDGVVARAVRDSGGALLAAAAVRPGPRGRVAASLVDPRARRRRLAPALLDWALGTVDSTARAGETGTGGDGGTVGGTGGHGHGWDAAGARPPATVVETEALTEDLVRLFASRGLRQVFAEDVLRFDLAARRPPEIALPAGVRLEPWSAATAERFFAVYTAAFAAQPGFPGWSARRWIAWLTEDDFRPEWSMLAVDARAGDVGFVACADGWVVQVGVRPDQRRRRLGAGLLTEALSRMRTAGQPAALLDVRVDNPAGELYRRLGFSPVGRRARYAVS